jgi:hypothetical protein
MKRVSITISKELQALDACKHYGYQEAIRFGSNLWMNLSGQFSNTEGSWLADTVRWLTTCRRLTLAYSIHELEERKYVRLQIMAVTREEIFTVKSVKFLFDLETGETRPSL